jgi:NMD protein affecting ribosome stability and mRNA decay
MPSAKFDKVCKRCSKEKHISEFKRNKKINPICNDCGAVNIKKVCPRCNKEKYKNLFSRNSAMCQICNKCNEESVKKMGDIFNIAFSLLNKSEEDVKKCIHQ